MPQSTTPPGGPGPAHSKADGPEPNRPAYDPLLAFETILAGSGLNVTIFDRQYRVSEVSSPAAALARMSREQMRGRSLLEDLPVAYHDNLARTLAGEAIHA